MDQNYTYFCKIGKDCILCMCRRILVISLCVPWEDKGWKFLGKGDYKTYFLRTIQSYFKGHEITSCEVFGFPLPLPKSNFPDCQVLSWAERENTIKLSLFYHFSLIFVFNLETIFLFRKLQIQCIETFSLLNHLRICCQ